MSLPMLAFAESVYRRHLEKRRARFLKTPSRLPVPVVSVGNLTLGGTGKTPAVGFLARALFPQKIGIVARGYRGSARGVAVVSDGETIKLSTRECGDEPLLHARALPGAVVVVGRDRVQAAQFAIELGAEILVCDDAFSYWSLGRDFDLVLLDARRPFDNNHLLPRGRLREEAASLARADCLLLSRCDRASADELAATQNALAPFGLPIFRSTHAPQHLRDITTNEIQTLEILRDAPIGALSGLADNAAFAAMLENRGAKVLSHTAARDHHAWRESEVEQILRQMKSRGARFAVTTAKDAVKLPAREWPLPFLVLDIELQIENEGAFLGLVKHKLSTVEFAPAL